MNTAPKWWTGARRVSVVVDNDSWELPYAQRLVDEAVSRGDTAALCRDHVAIEQGDIAFYLGCIKLTPPDVLARNRRNLVVHASDLPKGRGLSPVTWQVLEGKNEIVMCLLEAAEEADSGPVIYRQTVDFAGHELIDEMHARLGEVTLDLCRRYLSEPEPLQGEPQRGEASTYSRRCPKDSQLDPNRPLAEQFDLLRIVDDDKYPAYFDMRGHRYAIAIRKIDAKEK